MTTIQAKNVNHPDHQENLNSEKYHLIREAMLAALPDWNSHESLDFAELENRVHTYLKDRKVSPSLFPKPGSVRWYTKAVQLDLEAKGEIERLPNHTPMRLRKGKTGQS